MSPEIRRARRAFLRVGVLAPTAITLLSAVVMLVWLPQLPDPAATHWSGGGGPDGFAPAWTYLLLGIGPPLILIAAFAALALYAHRLPPRDPDGPQWSPTARFLGAVNVGLAGMMAVVMLTSVGVQRGLEDAADAPDITPWVFAGFAVGVALTAAGWFLQPAVQSPEGRRLRDAPALTLGPGERAAWVETATMARAGIVVLTVAVAVLVVTTVVLFALAVPSWWVLAFVSAALVALMLTMLTFRVRVASDGLLVRSATGWPRFRIRPDEVRSVRTTSVHPFSEFGGWGVRLSADGRFGVVLRAGEALEVTRTNGRTFIVTVDDAGTGAALLSAVCTGAASPTQREESK